ncbi:MAG TPA: ankyrin repeat domain-containing protein [Patescibacteria group bacterium]|nr:ankyrin repeat domain-containing protein [Patescibacteria group bacterium]
MYINHTHPKAIEDMFKSVDDEDLDNLRFYITDGADPDQKNDKGITLLQHAMTNRKIAAAETLLEMGADPDFADARGETALHYAARMNHTHMIGVLLHNQASIDKPDDFGWTPLHTAAACGKLEAVKELVEHGADMSLKDSQRDRPLDLVVLRANHQNAVISAPYPPVVAYLREQMEKKTVPIASPEERETLVARDMQALRRHNPGRYKLRP